MMQAHTLRPAASHSLRRALAKREHPSRSSVRVFAQEDDFVTRMVGNIFGQKVINDRKPFGLNRVDWSKIPDQFVVEDRDAEAVETDDAEMMLIRPLLAGTQLEAEHLRLAFDAERDGWLYQPFHELVDGYGATVVIAQTAGGAVVGGYNPSGYDGMGEKASNGAFLFTWPDGDTSKRPFKLPKVETPQLAIIDRMEQGPQFGPGDLKIPLSPSEPRLARSKLVDYKKVGPGAGGKTLFAQEERSGRTELSWLRAYVRKGGKLKYELDGLRWKSSYTEEGDPQGQGPPSGIFFF